MELIRYYQDNGDDNVRFPPVVLHQLICTCLHRGVINATKRLQTLKRRCHLVFYTLYTFSDRTFFKANVGAALFQTLENVVGKKDFYIRPNYDVLSTLRQNGSNATQCGWPLSIKNISFHSQNVLMVNYHLKQHPSLCFFLATSTRSRTTTKTIRKSGILRYMLLCLYCNPVTAR